MGPSLKHDNLSEAGETRDNTKWNFHYARSCYHHHRHPQRNQEAKMRKGGPWWLVVGAGGRVACLSWWGSQRPLHGASVCENSCREVWAELRAWIPNIHAECFIFVTVHDKIYLYICMPNALYAKKRVFIYLFGEVCICCANQSVIVPVSYVPKVFPTTLSTKEGN